MWCEGDLHLADIRTKNVRLDELNPILGYAVVRLYNLHNTCQREVIGYRRLRGTFFLNEPTGLIL